MMQLSVVDEYETFIEQKLRTKPMVGFVVGELNKNLFPFQDFLVRRALLNGRYAIFADTGLGKSLMQLEWAYRVRQHTSGPVLILAPLAVTAQTIEEAARFGISLDGITVTNYEQLDNIDCAAFSGVVLDESGILKFFDGATKKKLIEYFSNTPYKLCCSATPSPNDPEELGNHAEFLNIMTRQEMLSMYFVHDAADTGDWQIKGHAVKHFWQFVSSWAIMLNNPRDIGFPMDGYDLPGLEMIEHKIETSKKDNGEFFNSTAVSATDFNGELRRTKTERLAIAANIAKSTDEQIIIWIKQDEEGVMLRQLLPDAIEVKGSDSPEYKKSHLLGFAKKEFRILITKSVIARFGLNWQSCHKQVFASLDFSFESLYQSIRRSYRFGQKERVQVYLITTDTMANVVQSIEKKQENFKEMQRQMTEAVNATLNNTTLTGPVYDVDSVKTENYEIHRSDCVRFIKSMPDNSIDFSVYSPPFADLFVYSDHIEDMGNTRDFDQFIEQYGFLVREQYRTMKPGRLVAVHCMDLPTQKGRNGHIGLRDFSGHIRELFEKAGFIYHERITIWKDPVTAMQRTKALGLLYKQLRKDSTMSRVGIPDNVLVFRKDGTNAVPVPCELSLDDWQEWASPVWMDIDQGDTLNVRSAREDEDGKHLCALQLPVIQRLVHLYSNKGETVFTPFLGIGSEVYQSVKMGRKGIGTELKEAYFKQAVKNMSDLDKIMKQQELF